MTTTPTTGTASRSQQWAADVLDTTQTSGLRRRPRTRSGGSHRIAQVDGHDVVVLSSNDYLGLSIHPTVQRAAADAALQSGVGATGSRHLSGCHEAINALEQQLADFIGTETATVAPTGYQANLAILEALGGSDATIYSDQLNHASIVDGCRLSRSTVQVYQHLALEDLEQNLQRGSGRPIIVSDAIFSTDGAVADIAGLVALARHYDAWLVIDEAHALGVYGETGRGVCAETINHYPQLVRVVTFSKALGASGGAICGNSVVRQLLLQRGRALIFSTTLSHPSVAAAAASLAILRDEPQRVERLHRNSRVLHAALDLAVPSAAAHRSPDGPIAAVIIGEATRSVELEVEMCRAGYLVQALRPPTVPDGTSRLRFVATSEHTNEELQGAATALRDVINA